MSGARDTGGPAFPTSNGGSPYDGMTMRDFFAAKAMQGMLANPGGPIQRSDMCGWSYVNCTPQNVAALCYSMADEMLKERTQ